VTEPSAPRTEGKVLAFLDLGTFDDGASFRGGCLVTDERTRPLEFRVSGAIRPSALQKILYGDTLHEYICTVLLGGPLLKTLESRADFVLVRDAEFLKLRPQLEMPLLWLRSTVDGQYALQPFPGYEPEADAVGDAMPARLRGRNIMEPFLRIRAALEEAHSLQVGDSPKG
jgi:hypothetical protein